MKKTIKGLEDELREAQDAKEILLEDNHYLEWVVIRLKEEKRNMNRVWFTVCFVEWCLLVAVFFFH